MQPDLPNPVDDDAPAASIDLQDDAALAAWQRHFGVTREQLEEAVQAAGNRAAAVREHLLNQGSSAGVG